MTFLISDNGEFGKSLKFEARESAHSLSHGPVYGSAGYLALRLDPNGRDTNVYLQSSTDGVNWTDQSHNVTIPLAYITNLRYVNGKYFILGDDGNAGTTSYISHSTDMVNWTNYTNTNFNIGGLADITFSNNLWLIVVNGGSTSNIYSSTNLTSWTSRRSYTFPAGWLGYFTAFATSGTTTIAMGYGFDSARFKYTPYYLRSTNGTTWTNTSIGPNGGDNPINKQPLDIAWTGSSFVAVGTNGFIYNSNAAGDTWTASSYSTTTNLYTVGVNSGTTVIYGQGNTVFASTPGNSIELKTVPQIQTDDILSYSNGASQYSRAVYANSKWIVGDYTSTDTSTWTILDYQLPNKQPFIKYDYEPDWNTWKTIDLWVYIDSLSIPTGTILGIASSRGATTNSGWSMYFDKNGTNSFSLVVAGGTVGFNRFTITNTFSAAQWNHLRLVSDGNTGAFYLNGTRIGTLSTAATWGNGSDTLNIGYSAWVADNRNSRPTAYFLDEVMITREVLNSPTDSSIAVPTQPFVNNDYTSILLHYDTNFEDDPDYPIRNAQASIASEFTQTSQAIKLASAVADISANSSLTSSITRTRGITANLASSFSLSTNALDLDLAEVNLASSFSLTTTVGLIKQASSTQQSSTSVTADNNRIRSNSASLEAFDTLVMAIGRTQGFGAYIESSTALSTTPVKTVNVNSSLQSANTLSVVVKKTVQLSSILTVNSALTVNFDKVITFTSTEPTSSSMSTVAVKIARSPVSLSSNASMAVAISNEKQLEGSLFDNCSVTCLVTVTRTIISNQVATATLLAITNNVVRATANLQVSAFELVTGKTINLANSEIWVVPADNTTWKIGKDTNIWTIPSEDRTYII